jgi:uncharacterized protein YcfL
MKNIYGLFFLLALLLIGCSSTYTIKDFPSKERFYEDFNNSVKNKDVSITLMGDSSFSINDGIILEDDTLFSLEGKDKRSFPLSDITEIKYANNDYSSASISFKNGDILRGKDIRTDSDSIYFTIKTSTAKNNIAPIHIAIDKVKTITYKTRSEALAVGAGLGVVAGVTIASIAFATFKSKDNSNVQVIFSMFVVPAAVIAGAITGWLVGRNTYYQFYP